MICTMKNEDGAALKSSRRGREALRSTFLARTTVQRAAKESAATTVFPSSCARLEKKILPVKTRKLRLDQNTHILFLYCVHTYRPGLRVTPGQQATHSQHTYNGTLCNTCQHKSMPLNKPTKTAKLIASLSYCPKRQSSIESVKQDNAYYIKQTEPKSINDNHRSKITNTENKHPTKYMNPSERNKCRYPLVILVIDSFPKNPDELSQRAADSLLDAPVAVFQFGREPNMRETSAR